MKATSPEAATALLVGWLRDHDYRGFDPFDGLNATLRPLARTPRARQILLQGVRRFPANLRPLLGIEPARSTKGAAYIARAALKLARLGAPFDDQAAVAERQLEWLLEAASPGYSGLCWGNHFDYQSRVFYLPQGEPTVVWTALIGQAFVDAWLSTGRREYLDAVRSVATFILKDLERRPAGRGICISYIPSAFRDVHNANMLAAGFLARAGLICGETRYGVVASQAVAYTMGCQRPDGSFWYGEAEDLHWVDNFHTGYVLDSLWWYMSSSGDSTYVNGFDRAAAFYVDNFFLRDGTPKYYAHRVWPIDIQCAAQGIETLTVLGEVWDSRTVKLAERVADWTTTNMQDPDGHFYFQVLPWLTNKTPMLHWGQATMLHALACLLTSENDDHAG